MGIFTIYILFSTLDVIVVNMLILKLYRLPFMLYKFQLIGLSFVLAVVSFIIRTKVNLLILDLPLQYVIFVLFYYNVLVFRLHYAIFIVGSGLVAYISIQMLIYYIMMFIGIGDKLVIFSNIGFTVNLIHICSGIMGILIVIFLRITGRGFSFILPPPHSTYKIKYTEYNNLIVLGCVFKIG